MAAAGTKQGVKTILGLHWNDPGQFKDLMAQWLSCGGRGGLEKVVGGSARTPGGKYQDGIHLFGRQQVPPSCLYAPADRPVCVFWAFFLVRVLQLLLKMKTLICSIMCIFSFAIPIYANIPTDFCFVATGEKFGIDPLLLEAISYVESRNEPLAISHNQESIDYGHMQINSYWIKYLGVEYIKLNDPCFCTKVGAAILANCIDVHGFNKDALSCYNSGKKLDSLKPEVKTKVLAYIGSVKKRYNYLANTSGEVID